MTSAETCHIVTSAASIGREATSAVDLVRTASAVLGGKGGGGKPDMAQAGGPDGSKADDALAAIAAALGG